MCSVLLTCANLKQVAYILTDLTMESKSLWTEDLLLFYSQNFKNCVHSIFQQLWLPENFPRVSVACPPCFLWKIWAIFCTWALENIMCHSGQDSRCSGRVTRNSQCIFSVGKTMLWFPMGVWSSDLYILNTTKVIWILMGYMLYMSEWNMFKLFHFLLLHALHVQYIQSKRHSPLYLDWIYFFLFSRY